MTINGDQLKGCMPLIKVETIPAFVDAINNAAKTFDISTKLRMAHFLAQLCHESGHLKFSIESLKYSAKALVAVFGKYFPTIESALPYAYQEEMIGNKVYANRMGNGDTASGEGFKFRGRGAIQITGKNNYTEFSKKFGVDCVNNPDLLREPKNSLLAAGNYWSTRGLNVYADKDDIKEVTRRINGGYNGLKDREENLVRCKKVLGV